MINLGNDIIGEMYRRQWNAVQDVQEKITYNNIFYTTEDEYNFNRVISTATDQQRNVLQEMKND